jgi:presenilin-like A22 family membrane protease
MDVTRIAALVSVAGALTICLAVFLLAGYEWAILTVGGFLLAAGFLSLKE